MSLEADFERVWKPVASAIGGSLVKKQREENVVTLDDAAQAWRHEKRNWDDPMRVQSSFLSALEKKSPECARQFRAALDRFAFQEVELAALPSSAPYVAGTTGAAVLGGVVGGLLPQTSLLPRLVGRVPVIVIGGAVFAGLGGSVMRGLWQSKTQTVNEDAAQQYTAQLEPLKAALLEICRRADAM